MGHKGVRRNAPTHYAANRVFTFVVVVVECRHQHLEWGLGVYYGSWNGIDDGLKQWLQVTAFIIGMVHGYTVAPNGIENGEVQMRIGCCQFQEKVLRPFENLVDTSIAAINFVDDDDGL